MAPRGPDTDVEAARLTVDPFADADVAGGIDDEHDMAVLVGPRRCHMELASHAATPAS